MALKEAVEMVDLVLDEVVAATEILGVEVMSMTISFYEEAEMMADFLVEAATWMERAWCRATAMEF